MKIGFIGAGRVSVSFAKMLKNRGFDIEGFSSERMDSAKRAAASTESRAYPENRALAENCDMIFIGTPDGKIQDVWHEIKDVSGGKIICHFSGAETAEVFDGAEKCASLHPMMAVPDKNSEDKLKKAFYTAEGSAAEEIKSIFPFLSIQLINAADKPKYHAAAVTASNLAISLIDLSVQLLAECGFERENALAAIENMVKNNIQSVFDKGIEQSLTGPVERGDDKTIKKHLEALDGEAREAYIILSRHLLVAAQRKNPERDYSKIKGMCEE